MSNCYMTMCYLNPKMGRCLAKWQCTSHSLAFHHLRLKLTFIKNIDFSQIFQKSQ